MNAVMHSCSKDVLFALRVMRKNRGATVVSVLSLALGIGANTAIFQLVDAVRLRPLPVKNPSELVDVRILNMRSFVGWMRSGGGLTNALWEGVRDHQHSFSGVLAWSIDDLNLAQGGEVRNAHTMFVSGGFFRVLGIEAALGRTFSTDDDYHGCAASGAVISYGFWQREFGGDPAVLGRRLTLSRQSFQVIGVTPRNFTGIDVALNFDVAVPLCVEPLLFGENSLLDKRGGWWLSMKGRLKPGVSVTQASAELSVLSPGLLQAALPDFRQDAQKQFLSYRLGAVPTLPGRRLRARFESPLEILLAMTAAVLLIACANIANLRLVQAAAREREIAMRMALGASTGRIMRQALTESLLISLVAAVVGLALAQSLSSLLVATVNTRALPVSIEVPTDWRVLGFSACLAILTCCAFGLIPALRASRANPAGAMSGAGRGITGAPGQFRLNRMLIVLQVGLSMVLLMGALLLVRSFANLLHTELGFRADGVLVVSVNFAEAELHPERWKEMRNELTERLRSLPGVRSAAFASAAPLGGSTTNSGIVIDHQAKGSAFVSRVGSGFFETLGTTFLAGRDFNQRDSAGSPPVAIVNTAFAKEFFAGANPIGWKFSFTALPAEKQLTYQIVGVVQDSKLRGVRESSPSQAYLVTGQESQPGSFGEMLVRVGASPAEAIGRIKQSIAGVSPGINLEFRLLSDDVRDLLVTERAMAQIAGFFGVLAVILAMIGLYGVMAYIVTRRRNEIGIRMALGAGRALVLRMVFTEASRLTAIGMVAGMVIGLVAVRATASFLYGLQPRDPLTLVVAGVALATAAAAASYLPARNAAAIDPIVALREE